MPCGKSAMITEKAKTTTKEIAISLMRPVAQRALANL
jgi:hypothetical protein